MSTSSTAIYSEASDPSQVASLAAVLLVEGGGKWHLTSAGKGLEREFQFKTFKKTWDFMNVVANKSGKERHHPEWSNVYNRVFIRWTTHSPPGLGSQDVQMAQFCDEQAKALGELSEPGGTEVAKLLEPLVSVQAEA